MLNRKSFGIYEAPNIAHLTLTPLSLPSISVLYTEVVVTHSQKPNVTDNLVFKCILKNSYLKSKRKSCAATY